MKQVRAQAPAILATAAALLLAAGCARQPGAPRPALETRDLTPGFLAERAAGDACVAADSAGRVALTFVTRDSEGGRDLWIAVSRDGGSTFAEPSRLNAREGSVSSYSESRPIAVFGKGGRLAVAWTAKRAGPAAPRGKKPPPSAADMVVRVSRDGGASFGPEVAINDDVSSPKPVFHGFPAIAWLPRGLLFAAWNDERGLPGGEEEPGASSLYSAVSQDGGAHWSANRALTDQLCPCCRAAAAVDPSGRLAVTWRTARNNLRDPVIAFSSDGGLTFAPESTVSADRWALTGCPSEGNVLAYTADGAGLLAWKTGAEPAGVYFRAWLADGTPLARASIGDSIRDASHPRVAALSGVMFLAAEAIPASRSSSHALAVRARLDDGTLLPWVFLGEHVDASWLAASGAREALACWTDRSAHRVQLARIRLMETQ